MMIKYLIGLYLVSDLFLQPFPLQYTKGEAIINQKEETIYTLTVNMASEGIVMENGLSFNYVYGFETTTSISQRTDALAAVNGVFYDQYGRYIGGLVMDSAWIGYPHTMTPMVTIDPNNQVSIQEIETVQSIQTGQKEIQLNGVNQAAYYKEWVLYTPHYGKTTRIGRQSMNYILVDGQVVDRQYTSDPVIIPEEGYVLSQVTTEPTPELEIGEQYTLKSVTNQGIDIEEAFQSGGWLVKEGEIVVKEEEPFIGFTNYPAPRTLLGITKDNQVILKVIDGRQAGYSIGVTGREAARVMLEAGCTDAVYLDGGASTTMVINHQLMNQPSSGSEREVAHAIILKMEEITGIYGEDMLH